MTVDLNGMSREQFQAYYETLAPEHKPAALAAMKKQLRDSPAPRFDAAKQTPGRTTALDVVEIEPEWETWWLPEPVRDWVEAVAATYAVPRVMPIAVALCAAATLAQGKASVRIKPGWDEPLCLFWAVAAPTGSRKSAVLTAGTRYIRTIQAHAADAISEEKRAKDARLKHALAQQRSLNAKVKYHDRKDSDGSNTWQSNEESSAEQLREVEGDIRRLTQQRTATREPGIPSAPRWLREDINPTVIPSVMRANYEAEGLARMAILEGEGSFLQNAMGRHSHSQTAVEPLLKAYQGEPLELTRRAPNSSDLVEVSLPACYLTLLTLVQPHVLGKLVGTSELAENGLLGRCIASQLPATPALPALDAPQVPEAVQAAYDAWLWSIHQVPAGTVVDLSAYTEPGQPLHTLYGLVGTHVASDTGGSGWAIRTVGRVARVMALIELSNWRTVEATPQGEDGYPVREGVKKLNYLIYILYYRALTAAQAREPVTAPTEALTHRALGWFARASSPVGHCFTFRELKRALRTGEAVTEKLIGELASSRHIELVSEVRNRNKSVTSTYRILSTDPMGDDRPRPPRAPKPEQEPPPPPSPEDDGRDPDFQGDDLT